MKKFYLLSFAMFFSAIAYARYSTPGTGVRWILANLVTSSGGVVTSPSEGNYQVSDTVFISQYDTLTITSNTTVAFTPNTYFDVNGVIIINPPTNVTFTATNITSGYLGMRLDSTNGSQLRKLTFEYAVSLRIADCSPTIDSCIFRYNNNSTSTNFGTSAIVLFRSSPLITNSQFLSNQRAAISGGSNINNAPKIYNCLFGGNNTQNANVPQINLGATGADTVRIIGNQFLQASMNSGGIGFLPTGTVNAVITSNIIKKNRYGLTFNGGSNINALVSYNQIDSNNIQNDPILGGSGIAFSGGSATSHQNVVVTGNLIRWNLWGITVGPTSTGGGAKPNLGNLSNTDTADNGKNQIYGNTNASTPNIDLYNNNVDSIYAENNYWGSNDLTVVESHIFHKPDNAALGIVLYQPLYTPLPLKLLSFSANYNSRDVLLNWQTTAEVNTSYFTIERSADGRTFSDIGMVPTADITSSTHQYHFTDASIPTQTKQLYYRLKIVDKDGIFTHSKTVIVSLKDGSKEPSVIVYPTIVNAAQTVQATLNNTTEELIKITWYDAQGSLLAQNSIYVYAGRNTLLLTPSVMLPNGRILVRFTGASFNNTVTIIKQ